jgi:SAM-dependent methyltransferase
MAAERPTLFDFRTARAARMRANRIAGDRFLDQAAIEGLTDRLAAVTRHFEHGLWIGETLPPMMEPRARQWSVADFDEREILGAGEAQFDLIISLYSLQSTNDLPGALIQIRRALKPDGLFLATLFGAATLSELRQSFAFAESESMGGVSPHIAPFADVRDMGALLQRGGFALPVADVERLRVRYSDLASLVRDLRAHGQSNALAARRKFFLGRRTLESLIAYYAAHHGSDGKLDATFETLYLTGWAPHPNQQQPLKPGSAKSRLSDALGAVERKL